MSRHVFDELASLPDLVEVRRITNFDQVGHGFGNSGMSDDAIRRQLTGSLKTFHTFDMHFFHPRHTHATYCLVWYDIPDGTLAFFVRRLLRHPQFNTHAKRLGKVIRVSPTHVEYYSVSARGKKKIEW